MQMVVWTTVDDGEPVTETLYFSYGASGIPMSLVYNGTDYYYTVSLQGDVTAILNTSGTAVVEYTYDAWGRLLSTSGSMASTLGQINPLRYRGYVYDQETGLYYLQSRYYQPAIGRFISADSQLSTGELSGLNLFAYCNNNPTMLLDPSGMAPEWWQWLISGTMVAAGAALIATGIGGAAGGALICAGANSIISSYISEASGGSPDAGWAGGMITGAVSGLGAGLAGNMLFAAAEMTGAACLGTVAAGCAVAFGFGVLGSTAGMAVTAAINKQSLNAEEIVVAGMLGGATNLCAGLASGIGAGIAGMPSISDTSRIVANFVVTCWSLGAETVADALNTVISIFR